MLARALRPYLGRVVTATRAFDLSMAHWSATCLSSETSDTNLSVLIECDSARYLFNCGEGTTRTLLQRKKGLRKFKAVFTSGVDTERSSGLPGLLMTLADSGTSKIDVFGPPGLNHFLASTRLYTMRETLALKSTEVSRPSRSPVYADENISVFAVPVSPDQNSTGFPSVKTSLKRKRSYDIELPSRTKEKPISEGDASFSPANDQSSETLDPSVWDSKEFQPSDLTGLRATRWRELILKHMFPGNTIQATTEAAKRNTLTMAQFNKYLPRISAEPISLNYIVMGAPGRGKFDAAKAMALGLKPGPARGKLARGETVITPEGKVITPDMVLGDPPRPEVMIFIDCPTPRHITGLTNSSDFQRFLKGGEYPVHCMVHLAGPGVLEDEQYQQWLMEFGGDVHHLFTGPGRTPDKITFTSSAYAQLRLSFLDSKIFRVPATTSFLSTPPENFVPNLKMRGIQQEHFVAMKPAKEPVVPTENDEIDLFHPATRKGGDREMTTLLQPRTIRCFQQVRELAAREEDQRQTPGNPGDDIVVTPLGTSSAMPSKYRNVSSLIVYIPASGYVLLDCGEGTLGQLRRHFGNDAEHVLRDIRCIFISHIHGDHHIGLSRLLSQRRKLQPTCTSPLFLIANQSTFMYLQEYSDLEDIGLDDPSVGVREIYSEHAHFGRRPFHISGYSVGEHTKVERSQKAISDLNSALNLASIATVDVWHRGRCYGIVIKHSDGWSIVYSGDTRPTDTLVRAGLNATLLIHEATLGDDQADIAALKGHSTVGQAIEIAKRMRAQNVLLTHFSNRFPKTPQLSNDSAITAVPVIAVAFDHASISIGDMWKMQRYLPAIEQSFLDSEDPEDEVVEVISAGP